MNFAQQYQLALLQAPFALFKMRKLSAQWLTIYSLSALVIFGAFSWALLANQETIKQIVLDYLFPASWQGISETLGEFLFEAQAKTVIINLILSGSLVLASILLFPIKEKFSAVFEQDANYDNGETDEFPLAFQALEEIKLFLVYLTAQSVILFIGYYPFVWSQWLSIILSYLFLFFTFGLDFIAPTLQRHRVRYSLILKLLIRKTALVLTFGLIFSLPVILLSRLLITDPNYSLIGLSSILFIVNIIFLSLAVPVGTHIASRLMKYTALTTPPEKKSMMLGYSIMTLLLLSSLYLHSRLFVSLHHKSQLIKAEYNIDWSSIDYHFPSFDQLTNGKTVSDLSFDIVISNPTAFDIDIERTQIVIEQKQKTIANLDLTGFSLLAGDKRRIKMRIDSNSDFSQLSDFKSILDDWRVDAHIQVWPGIPFVVNIIDS